MNEPPDKPRSPGAFLSRVIGRLGLYATYVSAAMVVVVIAADLDVLVRHAALVGWLALLIGTGPLVAVLLSTIASYSNYYGIWRILRGHDTYDAGEDLKSHAADLPQAAQAMLARRAGCLPAVSTVVLASSLLLGAATMLPPATPLIGDLGTWSDHVGILTLGPSAAQPTVAPTPTPTATAAPTATATPVPVVMALTLSPAQAAWSCAKQGAQPAAQTVTLDTAGSTVAVSWHADAVEQDGAGQLWAIISPTSGTIPAAATQSITITPDPQTPGELCRSSQPAGTPWHVTIVADGGGINVFTYTIYS